MVTYCSDEIDDNVYPFAIRSFFDALGEIFGLVVDGVGGTVGHALQEIKFPRGPRCSDNSVPASRREENYQRWDRIDDSTKTHAPCRLAT